MSNTMETILLETSEHIKLNLMNNEKGRSYIYLIK